MLKTSVIILNWNGQRFLEKFLPKVVEYTADDDTQIIIADNGSSDDSLNYVKQNFPSLPLIAFSRNYGFTSGYNRAISQINTKYIVLLNSDIEVTRNWLAPLVSFLDKNDNISACMPKILSQRDTKSFEYAGAAGGFVDIFGYPFCRGRILNSIEADNHQYDTARRVFWASGACMFVRTDVYKALGGLDDVFFAHMEEIDLCWRMQNAGYEVWCLPQSVVYHVGGGTLPNDNPKKLYFNYRNNLLMLYKNLPAGYFYAVLITRGAMDALSALIFLFKGKIKFFAAVVRAYFHFIRMRRGKRLHNGDFSRVYGVYRRSIVVDYFIRGIKKFDKIDAFSAKRVVSIGDIGDL